MPLIVGNTQSSFVKGRQTTDNIIIAQEIIHSMQNMRGAKGSIAIKVDLEKAYDRIRWYFVIDTVHDIGFSAKFTNLIFHCLASSDM